MASEPTSGPINGQGGNVKIDSSAVADIRNWNVTRNADIPTYVSSSTAGYKKTAKGNIGWEGQFEIYTDQGSQNLDFAINDLVDFEGLAKSGSTIISGEVRISSITAGVDIEGNAFQGATINFIGDGAYTLA